LRGLRVHVNYVRVREVSELLSILGPYKLMELEERLDPQFKALKRLAQVVGKGWASVYALLVSLVSYKLLMRGEEWWDCMSSFIASRRGGRPPSSTRDAVDDVIWFIDNCRGSALARDARKRRILKVYTSSRELLEKLALDPEYFYSNMEVMVKALARALDVEEWRKTVVFTAKMVYYAIRDPGDRRLVNLNIPIPVDTRVACASYSSMVVEAGSYMEVMRSPKPAQEAWNEVSRRTGIPVLNLDSLLWLTGWAPRDLSLENARGRVEDILSNVVERETAREIAQRLYMRKC
jgi:DNA-(apurinic or apyrimidinic site) lyase